MIYDVIIIGCGASGIGAGIEFNKLKSKLNVLILEGRDRIGGRTFTDKTRFGENVPIDIGGHYLCHGKENNLLFKYYIPSDKDFVESDIYDKSNMKIFDKNGNIICDDLIFEATKLVENLFEIVKEYSNNDLSILDLIKDHLDKISDNDLKDLVKMFLSYTELHEGSDLNVLSSKCYLEGEGGSEQFDLSLWNGLGSLMNDICSKSNLPIKLSSIVTNLNVSNDLVEVITKDKCLYLCKYVLLTIPLGCLKSNTIQFNPSLPEWKKESIEKMGFGLLNKIYLQFYEIFWDKNVRRINVVDEKFKFYYCLPEYSMLSLYISGQVAKELEQKTDEETISEIISSLSRIYPSITYPIKWLITRWGNDPFSYGSYSSFHRGNHLETLKQLSRETHDGKIHWGGEHTNWNGSIGYVHSAFESGIREAKLILNKFHS
jgi:monoamine oxidase